MPESGLSAAAPPLAPRFVLVTTKLHVPELRPGLIARSELLARLAAGADGKLTLVCAPAGWGKSLVLAEWHASETERRPFAWVSLDPDDDDPVRFWSYVVGAVQTVEPRFGDTALAALPAAGPALLEAVLPSLVNELAGLPRPIVLVLDDYHVLRDDLIHASVAFLLRHLPRTVHVAIASRSDPPISLVRLRAAGEVTEVRASELQFSEGEATALLNDRLALDLEVADVALLRERTEGWPAGLALAALSLRDRTDRSAFIRAFAGDDRHIGEYLHEVIEAQPRPVRKFLLRTAILESLCAPLCDAVTGGGDAAALLAEAHRSNLFLIALDDRGHWFRYHHLFRDLLREELARSEPELVAELHRRAAVWYEANGEVDDAIVHATAAGEFDSAGELIAQHWRPAFQVSPRTVIRWLRALPPGAVFADARLSIAGAWAAMSSGRLDEVERCIRAAERDPDPRPLADGGSVEANVVMARSAVAHLLGDVGRAAELARCADALVDDAASLFGSANIMFVGQTSYYAGDPEGAIEPLETALRSLKLAPGWTQTVITALGLLAAARADLGESEEAELLTTEAERLIAESGFGDASVASIATVARGKLHELRSDHAAADAAFARAALLARRGGWPLDLGHALILQSVVKRRRKDYAGARSLVREARRVLARCPDPGMLPELLAGSERGLQLAPARTGGPAPSSSSQLSERELVVLRLLATDLSQREIASQLFVSFNTVKSHTRSVFRKLGVSSRPDAVARGRELGLLS